MSDFLQFQEEYKRQKVKLAETWSLLHTSQSPQFAPLYYDVKGYDPGLSDIDLTTHVILERTQLNLDFQIDLLDNAIERMELAVKLMNLQMIYGLKADPSPPDLMDCIDDDERAFQKLADHVSLVRSGQFASGFHDVTHMVPTQTLQDKYNLIAGLAADFRNGVIPEEVADLDDSQLLQAIYDRRVDYAEAYLERAEIYNTRADRLLISDLKVRKAVDDGILPGRAETRMDSRRTIDVIRHDLKTADSILESARVFIKDLYDMSNSASFESFKPERYAPASVLKLTP